jgi:hypothetical protein
VSLLETLLPIARHLAESLEGTSAGQDALTDVRNLEALAATHEREAAAWAEQHLRETEAKASAWLEAWMRQHVPAGPAA